MYVRNGSPTYELLEILSSRNMTILDLFRLLQRMEHYRAMIILKPFVNSRYHSLIREGNELSDSYRDSIPIPEGSDFDGLKRFVPVLSLEEVEKITNSWDSTRLLGRGGFGNVYQATWKETTVAIKRPDPHRATQASNPPEVQILRSLKELKHLNSSRHDNILPLCAYSLENRKYILIYQYMLNGCLEDRLRCRNDTTPLSWDHRYNIAKGTARGIQFLHEMSEPLIHGDIKNANILLDEHWVPKIGDFGLAQEVPKSPESHITLHEVHGTRVYLPREYLLSKKLRPSVDTYSFGVVLCELATGRIPCDNTKLVELLRNYFYKYPPDQLTELMDPKAGSANEYSSFIFRTLISPAKECINLECRKRPKMRDVFRQLENSGQMIDDMRRSMKRPQAPIAHYVQICPVERQNPSPTNQLNQPVAVVPVQEANVNPIVESKLPLVADIVLTLPLPNVEGHNSTIAASETSSHNSSSSSDVSVNELPVISVELSLETGSLGNHGTDLEIPNLTILQKGIEH